MAATTETGDTCSPSTATFLMSQTARNWTHVSMRIQTCQLIKNLWPATQGPDKYDPHGPYASLTGKDSVPRCSTSSTSSRSGANRATAASLVLKSWLVWLLVCQDLTWGLFAGVDTVEYTNKLDAQPGKLYEQREKVTSSSKRQAWKAHFKREARMIPPESFEIGWSFGSYRQLRKSSCIESFLKYREQYPLNPFDRCI